MAKRFTDNQKWEDPWFMDLPSKYKLFWIWILDNCDHAGVWKVNFKVAQFFVGEHLEPSEVKRYFKGRIQEISDEHWYIKKFVEFQYKCSPTELNPKNKAHLSVIKILNQYNLLAPYKPLDSPLQGVKDKDKDKDKEGKTLENLLLSDPMFTESFIRKYNHKFDERTVKDMLKKCSNSDEQKGNYYTDENIKQARLRFDGYIQSINLNQRLNGKSKKPKEDISKSNWDGRPVMESW